MADNQLFNEIGDEISRALKQGLKNGNFGGLDSAIRSSVNRVLDDATEHLERSILGGGAQNVSTHKYSTYSDGAATREKQKQLEREREERRQREAARRAQRESAYVKRPGEAPLRSGTNATEQRQKSISERRKREELKRLLRSPNSIVVNGQLLPTKFKAVGDNTSLLYLVLGIIGTSLFGLITLMLAIAATVDSSMGIGILVCSILTIVSIAAIVKGGNDRNLIKRAKRYAQLCGTKMYSTIARLASATGTEEKKLRKDIKKMLKKGFYPEGYLDTEETTLMLSEEVYREYDTMKSRQKAEEAAKEAELTTEEKSELEVMVSDGMEAIEKLHRLNDDIPGEVISAKLSYLEDVLKQIFNRVSEHPEQMDRMHKLMDYYLPTMLKLVEAYAEYDKVSAPGKEIKDAKSEIENTLDTINEAFVQLLNNLFRDSVWDVTSDAQVLTTMLTQEGLAQEPVLKGQ